jgi:hypothetical protein
LSLEEWPIGGLENLLFYLARNNHWNLMASFSHKLHWKKEEKNVSNSYLEACVINSSAPFLWCCSVCLSASSLLAIISWTCWHPSYLPVALCTCSLPKLISVSVMIKLLWKRFVWTEMVRKWARKLCPQNAKSKKM